MTASKNCTQCGDEKSLYNFHRNAASPDGRQTACKVCRNAALREYKKTARGREVICRAAQKRSKSPQRKAYMREYNRKHQKSPQRKAYMREYRKSPQYKARQAVHRAVKTGKLIRPHECSLCQRECTPDGHHPDYSKPLEVVWLCRQCHSAHHNSTNALTGTPEKIL